MTLILNVAALALFALSACGKVPQFTDTSTGCAPGIAMVLVHDNFLQALCGCQGVTDGTQFYAGTPLNCTVNAGEQVWFRFEGTRRRHQVVSTGTPSFNASNLIDPARNPSQLSLLRPPYPVTFDTPGVYPFADKFISEHSGTITVL